MQIKRFRPVAGNVFSSFAAEAKVNLAIQFD